MNVDPNNPSEALPDLLLSSALTSMSDVAGAVTGALYVQYFSETQYTEDSRYGTEQFSFDYWYSTPLNDCQAIIDSESATDNYKAAARITKAYFMHMMTDRWGMLPYSEALQGAGAGSEGALQWASIQAEAGLEAFGQVAYLPVGLAVIFLALFVFTPKKATNH